MDRTRHACRFTSMAFVHLYRRTMFGRQSWIYRLKTCILASWTLCKQDPPVQNRWIPSERYPRGMEPKGDVTLVKGFLFVSGNKQFVFGVVLRILVNLLLHSNHNCRQCLCFLDRHTLPAVYIQKFRQTYGMSAGIFYRSTKCRASGIFI